jgi:hypothetical protein
VAGGGGGRNGNPALLFLLHPVHGGSTLMNLPKPMGPAGIEQDAFARGGFAGVDVRHNADIADFIQRVTSGHVFAFSSF